MRFVARFLLLVTLLSGAGGMAAAERIPPAPARHFNDYAGAVSTSTADTLDRELAQYERESSNQLLVAIYPHMESDSSIEDYTVRVAESWHAGQKGRNNGAVLFVFKNDRKMYLQVGYGLEPTLTDARAHDIIENILKPHFRRGDFDGGLRDAVGAMIAATKGEFKGTGRTRAESPSGPRALGGFELLILLFFVGVPAFFVVAIVRRLRRAIVLGNPGRRRVLPGNPWWWGGGGFGGGSGGSFGGGSFGGFGGGGGGGFSGGGGSFGGGGAGGSW